MKKTLAIISVVLVLILGFSYFKFRPGSNSGSGEIKDTPIKETSEDINIKNGQISEDEDFNKEDDFIKSQKIDEEFNKISDYGKGFTMSYYSDMEIDSSMSEVKTIMQNDKTKIEVYYDDFSKNENDSYEAYRNYSNMFLENHDHAHKKEFESNERINDRETHILSWSRDKLKHVENDKNHYLSVEMKSLDNESDVYTIFMKSTEPFKEGEGDYKDIVESFRIIEKEATSKVNETFKVNKDRKLNEETQEVYDKYFADEDSFEWGIFENSAPKDMEFLNELEERMDYDFDFLVKYQGFSSPDKAAIEELENAYEQGKTVELTLQTTYEEKDNYDGLYKILNGEYDEYFNEYAKNIKDFGHPVLFRLNNEMNGDWCEYSSYHTSKDTDVFTEVWRHVHDIFEENGANENTLWVWNPHDISFPNFSWNNYLNYYPGDEYVDLVGLTGYNNGTYYPGEVWRDFEEIYDPIYDDYVEKFEQPLMITEFSANSVGGDKIAWINDMFDKMKKYDRIKVAIWWNGIDWDENMDPARIYRLDENEEMLDTFKERFQEYK